MKRKKFFVLGFLALTLMISVNAWEHINIDYGKTIGVDTLGVKSNGMPCFVYLDTDNLNIVYSCLISLSGATTDLIVTNISAPNVYIYGSLAVDPFNIGHICLVNGSGKELLYWNSNSQTLTKLSSSSHLYCDIAVDKDGNPHITENTNEKEWYYSGGWNSLSIASPIGTAATYLNTPTKISNDDIKYILRVVDVGVPDELLIMNSTDYTGAVSTYGDFEETFSGSGVHSFSDLEVYENRLYFIHRQAQTYYNLTVQGIAYDNTSFNSIWVDTVGAVDLGYNIEVDSGNIYVAYVDSGTFYLATNKSGSFSDTNQFTVNASTEQFGFQFDDGVTKWALTTSTDSYIRVSYDAVTYTVTGNILDDSDLSIIENAFICYDSQTALFCDYSNSTGGYQVEVPEGEYSVNITKIGYNKYESSGIVIDSDTSIDYYLTSESGASGNQSSILFTFLHYITHEPIVSETIEFEYVSGYGCLCGKKYNYVTDSNGQIDRIIYRGDYHLSPKGDYLIYNEWDKIYTITVLYPVYNPTENKVFYLKPYSDIENLVYGKTKDATTGTNLANITINMYNDEDFYTALSNTSGDYRLLDTNAGEYKIYGYDAHPPIQYDKTSEDTIFVENETYLDIYLYPKETEDTITLRWNITNCSNDAPLSDVTTIMEDSNGLPVYFNLSGTDGLAIISGIEPGFYNISHRKTGFITTSSAYYFTKSFNLSTCLREYGEEICYKINGTILDKAGSPVQLAEFKVKNQYGDLLSYITDSTGEYDTDKDKGGRCLEIGYYTISVTRIGYNDYSELVFLDENLTSHNITLNGSEELVTYTVLVGDKKTYLPIEGAKINLTEEYNTFNETIRKICYHPDTADGCIFSNLREGHYVVEITADGYNSERFRKYIAGDSKSVVLLDESEPHFILRIQIIADEYVNYTIYGEPENIGQFNVSVQDALVSIYKLGDNNEEEFLRTETTNQAGYVWFDSMTKNNYKVVAEKENYKTGEITVYLDSDKEEIIKLETYDEGYSPQDLEYNKQTATNTILYVLYNWFYLPLGVVVMFLVTSFILMLRDVGKALGF